MPASLIDSLSDAAWSVWGKTSRSSKEVPSPDRWLPLAAHLNDAGEVGAWLWDHQVSTQTKQLVMSTMGIPEVAGRGLLAWLCGIHDIGKVCPAFAVKVSAVGLPISERTPLLTDRMEASGLKIGNVRDWHRAPHGAVGAVAVKEWFSAHKLSDRAALPWAGLVGGHHGTPVPGEKLTKLQFDTRLVGAGSWRQVRFELLDAAADAWLTPALWDFLRSGRRVPMAVQTQLGGLIVEADWIASNEHYFPHIPLTQVRMSQDPRQLRLRRAMRKLALVPAWRPVMPDPATIYADRFNRTPRPLQVEAVKVAQAMNPHGLMIIEAPMAYGKTECGLAVAEILAARTGASGVAMALPTQATSDSMLTRFLSWMEKIPGDKDVVLAHGQALLNENFTQVRGWRLPPVPKPRPAGEEDTERDEAKSRVLAHRWLTEGRKSPLAGFMIGTVDQILLAALNAKHVSLRHAGLGGKVVIIDEVHAVDVYMSQYLQRAIEWLAAFGCPVVLLSATLPTQARQDLFAAYARGAQHPNPGPLPPAGYPSITYTTPSGAPAVATVPQVGPGTPVHLTPLNDDTETLVRQLQVDLATGGCAVVIRDTVRRVQEAADALEAAFPGEVTVLHARFLACDRKTREAQLTAMFGPDEDGKPAERPYRHIVVASQVVEQSLDVDFDVMVSDIAPIDLLLQRVGRLHRHARPGRPIATARCYITGVRDWDAKVPTLDKGVKRVYAPVLLHRALAVLSDGGHLTGVPIRLPASIPTLVQAGYSDAPVGPADWQQTLEAEHEAFVDSEKRRVASADVYRLSSPHTGRTTIGWQDGIADTKDANPDVHGSSRVRDGLSSVDVLVAVRRSDGKIVVPRWAATAAAGRVLPLDRLVTPRVARSLRACRLRLPVGMSAGESREETVADLERFCVTAWQDEHSLLAGELVMVLDESPEGGQASVGRYEVTYSTARGLVEVRIPTE